MQLTPVQQETLDVLRGDRDERPAVDAGLRAALQAELDLATENIEGRLTIDKYRLNKVHQCEGLYSAVDVFEWRPATARGVIAHKAIELSVGGVKRTTPHELVSMACERICESPENPSLADYLRQIGDGERAELRSEAGNLIIGFMEMFPPLQPHWIPHAEATTAAITARKQVVCRGKIDLKLGQLDGARSSTVIIDMKTGNPAFSHLDDLRFYGLLETLRTGVPPFQWANVYLSSGKVEVERCSEAVLWTALRRLIDGIQKIARLELANKQPHLTPGVGCRFCPAQPTCEQAEAYEASLSQF